MANENKKPEVKKPRFNAYWIYAAIIMIFLGIQFFGGNSWSQPTQTTQAEFETFLRDGDVDQIEIINKKLAKVYLTPEAKQKPVHSGNKKPSIFSGGSEPSYQFEFGDLQNFENTINEIKAENDLNTKIVWNTDSNMWGELFLTLLPFIVIIGIWIFIMRRMSAGAGGGAGGRRGTL